MCVCVCTSKYREHRQKGDLSKYGQKHNVAGMVDGMKMDVHNFNIL